jgi:hypothetical protein
MISSAVVQETVSEILSNMKDKYKRRSNHKQHSERLEMRYMVVTTQVRFVIGANCGVDFKKIPSPVKSGFGDFLTREMISSF